MVVSWPTKGLEALPSPHATSRSPRDVGGSSALWSLFKIQYPNIARSSAGYYPKSRKRALCLEDFMRCMERACYSLWPLPICLHAPPPPATAPRVAAITTTPPQPTASTNAIPWISYCFQKKKTSQHEDIGGWLRTASPESDIARARLVFPRVPTLLAMAGRSFSVSSLISFFQEKRFPLNMESKSIEPK